MEEDNVNLVLGIDDYLKVLYLEEELHRYKDDGVMCNLLRIKSCEYLEDSIGTWECSIRWVNIVLKP